MSRLAKGIIIGAVVLIVLVVAAGFIIGNYFFDLALSNTSNKSIVFGASQNTENVSGEDESAAARDEIAQWWQAQAPDDTYIDSDDGLKLHAYEMTQALPSNLWIIGVHGYTGNARQMGGFAREFMGFGYNVLLPDCRGHGLSEGDYIGMGWPDRLDIVSWIDYIIDKQSDAQIVLFGISMGGATVMMTAGEPLPANVKAIVEDCGYTSVWDEFTYQLSELFGLPSFPVMNFASLVTKLKIGFTLEEASAVKQLQKAKVPMLFIHGDEDTFVPFYMLDIVYDACASEKEKYIVSGAAHGEASSVAGQAYWDRVKLFIDKYVE